MILNSLANHICSKVIALKFCVLQDVSFGFFSHSTQNSVLARRGYQ